MVVGICFVALLVPVLLFLGVIGSGSSDALGVAAISEVVVGRCAEGWRAPDGRIVSQRSDTPVLVVACEELHDTELFARVEYSDPNGRVPPNLPGLAEMTRFANAVCPVRFAEYAGIAPTSTELVFTFAFPGGTAWSEGHRSIECLASFAHGEASGSARDANR